MIDAEKRSLLTDALTPPPGYRFDTGIATTYSLDLVTLLALPLHLSWLACGEENSRQIDPIRLIEALRRTADRLTVFANVAGCWYPACHPHSWHCWKGWFTKQKPLTAVLFTPRCGFCGLFLPIKMLKSNCDCWSCRET